MKELLELLKVYDGMTQPGFENARHDFRYVICIKIIVFILFFDWNLFYIDISPSSFKTEQTHVALYMTAIASVSTVVGKPYFKVSYFLFV